MSLAGGDKRLESVAAITLIIAAARSHRGGRLRQRSLLTQPELGHPRGLFTDNTVSKINTTRVAREAVTIGAADVADRH